jgi:Peptidase inhibitor family I36
VQYRKARVGETAVAGMVVVLVVLTVHSAWAQPRWGRPRVPRAGACFYSDIDFRGEYFCAGEGDDISSMPVDMNDKISSIRTFGNVEVRVFQDVSYRGRSERFDSSIRDLRSAGWNDRLSSIRVGRRLGGGGNRDRDDDYRSNRPVGGGGLDAEADQMVRRAYHDMLNREPDQSGLRAYRKRIIDDGWSEAQVREALRESPEFRTTRARAEQIVRRAYLSVLGREPDVASSGYVEKVLHDNWKQVDVERELRESSEYRRGRR